MGDEASGDHRADRVQPELEGRSNSEVTAAAANGPEEIGVLVGRGAADGSVGHDHFHRFQVVEGETVFRHQPSEAAAERQSGNAGRTNNTTCGREAVELSLAIELLPQNATLCTCGAC